MKDRIVSLEYDLNQANRAIISRNISEQELIRKMQELEANNNSLVADCTILKTKNLTVEAENINLTREIRLARNISWQAPYNTYAQATEQKPNGPKKINTDKELWAMVGLDGPPSSSSTSPNTSESGKAPMLSTPKKTLNTTCSKLAAEGGPKSLDVSVTDSATQLPREKLLTFTPKPAKRQASEGAAEAQHNWTGTGASDRSLNAPTRKSRPLPIFDAEMPEPLKSRLPPASMFPQLATVSRIPGEHYEPFRSIESNPLPDTDPLPSKRQRYN